MRGFRAPYVPLYQVVLLDDLESPQEVIEVVLRLEIDYVQQITYIVPVSDEIVFCDGMEEM